MVLCGRKPILTTETHIDESNVVEVLLSTNITHSLNQNEINILDSYFKGVQDIQNKTKETRVGINNKITENRAFEIVTFKKGYTFGEPIQYVLKGDEVNIDKLTEFNRYLSKCNKYKLDGDLAEWILISGQGYRMVTYNEAYSYDKTVSPIKVATLDPRNTFVIRCNDVFQKAIAGVTIVNDEYKQPTCYVYTDTHEYIVKGGVLESVKEHTLGVIPIIEYTSGRTRLGAFEVVIPLLDAINNVQSLRVDDLQQHVDSILAIFGGDMDEETYKKLQDWKTLVLPDGVDAKYLTSKLEQTGVQQLKEDLYDAILTICGMPNRQKSASGGDTGQAIIYRNGWTTAETQAKNFELEFIDGEREFIRKALLIINKVKDNFLTESDIEVKFGRRYAENINSKVSALIQLLDAGIEPRIAIATVGIWNDPVDVAVQSDKSLNARWIVNDEIEQINKEVVVDNV